MGSCLLLGKISDKECIAAAIDYLSSINMVNKNLTVKTSEECLGWINAPDNVDYIDILNLESVNMFLEHASAIEGFQDTNDALKNTKYKHLPWWMESIWLPVPLQQPSVPLIKNSGFPTFLGSSYGLLDDLKKLQQISNARLGEKPPGYDEMRNDTKTFYQTDFELEKDEHILQWVWMALYDGASISIKKNVPMQGIE